jgi:hypothetical protein
MCTVYGVVLTAAWNAARYGFAPVVPVSTMAGRGNTPEVVPLEKLVSERR